MRAVWESLEKQDRISLEYYTQRLMGDSEKVSENHNADKYVDNKG